MDDRKRQRTIPSFPFPRSSLVGLPVPTCACTLESAALPYRPEIPGLNHPGAHTKLTRSAECRKDKPHPDFLDPPSPYLYRIRQTDGPDPSPPSRAPVVANRHTVRVLLKHNIRSGSATHMQKLSTTDDVVQKSRLSLPQDDFAIITVTVVFPSNERASLL